MTTLLPRFGQPSLAERLFPRRYVRLALQLAAAVRDAGVTRLHAHFASRAAHVTMLASELLGIPYSFTAHAKDIYHVEVDRELLQVKMARAALVVTVSDYNRRTLLDLGAGIPQIAKKVVRLYNGVDLSVFHGALPANRATNLVLAVGRLVEKKGFPVLIHACGRLRRQGVSFSAEIVGDGDEREALLRLIDEQGLGDVVRLSGPLSVESIATKLRRAAVVALPCIVGSDGNVDALPTVLLEAMASGVPVVSTNLSGIPEIIVDGETGCLVPPGDPDRLADAIGGILADPATGARMGAAGRRRAEELFDLRRNVATLRELLARTSGER